MLDQLVRRAHRLARADALLHHGGGLAQPLPRRRRLGASRASFPKSRPRGATKRSRENGARCASVRRVVTGALEIERKEGRIGSSLEAAPKVYVADARLRAALDGVDLAEIAITSGAELLPGEGPSDAFRLDDVKGVAVVFEAAKGKKCARSWKILEEVGSDPEFPELSPRDAEAVRQFDARGGSAE